MRLALSVLLAAWLLTPSGWADDQPASSPAIDFPTSAEGVAQDAFLKGVRRLHCFEYAAARRHFQAARAARPDFAMACWGEAMTRVHPIWGEEDLGAARRALAPLGPTRDARAAKVPTERERAWIGALEVLLGDGSRASRLAAYEQAMAGLVQAYPKDFEARAFHALSILGTAQGVRKRAVYDRAAAVLKPLFEERPRHVGVAHYLVHCYDDPEHAHLALDAAHALEASAPDSTHALHMASHIYLPLGRWRDVISSNEASWRISGERNHHALYWLAYARTQVGDMAGAWNDLEIMSRHARRLRSPKPRLYLALMRAAHLVNGDSCEARAASIPVAFNAVRTDFAAAHFLADGLCAWRAGSPQGIATARGRVAALLKGDTKAPTQRIARQVRAVTQVVLDQLSALALLEAGKPEAAVKRLRAAADRVARMPRDFGPPSPPKPATELLGDVLERLQRPAEAANAYREALERHPGRRLALLGLARTARLADDAKLEAWAQEQASDHGVAIPETRSK